MKSLVKKYILKVAAFKKATDYSHGQLSSLLSDAQDTLSGKSPSTLNPASFARAAHIMVNAAELGGEEYHAAVQKGFEGFFSTKEFRKIVVMEILKSVDEGHVHPVTGKTVQMRLGQKDVIQVADKLIRGLRAWVAGLGAMDAASTFDKIDRALVTDMSSMVDSLYKDKTSLRSDIEEELPKILGKEELKIYNQGRAGDFTGFKNLFNRVFYTYLEGTERGDPKLQDELERAITDVFKQEFRKMAPKKAVALLHWLNELRSNKELGEEVTSKMKAVRYNRQAITRLVIDGINRHENYLSEMMAPYTPQEQKDEYPSSFIEKGVHGVVLTEALRQARSQGLMRGLNAVCAKLILLIDTRATSDHESIGEATLGDIDMPTLEEGVDRYQQLLKALKLNEKAQEKLDEYIVNAAHGEINPGLQEIFPQWDTPHFRDLIDTLRSRRIRNIKT